jgi:hypothetical protein
VAILDTPFYIGFAARAGSNHTSVCQIRIVHSGFRAASSLISMEISTLRPNELLDIETQCQHSAICEDADMATAAGTSEGFAK